VSDTHWDKTPLFDTFIIDMAETKTTPSWNQHAESLLAGIDQYDNVVIMSRHENCIWGTAGVDNNFHHPSTYNELLKALKDPQNTSRLRIGGQIPSSYFKVQVRSLILMQKGKKI
jgi:hypothetical protein